YSYGSHFELGRLVGKRNGGFFLLNGDRYSSSTTGHQSTTRGAVDSTGISSVIVPYTALHAAGIDLDSIPGLDSKPERVDSWTEDAGAAWSIDDPRAFVASEEKSAYRTVDGEPHYVARKWRFPGSAVHAVETLRGYGYGQDGGGWRTYEPGEQVRF